jgi:hypothetical protein
MARQKDVNKSEEIRQLYKVSPEISVKEVVSTLASRGIKVSESQVYFVKGKIKGRKGRKKRMHRMVSSVAATTGTGNGDAVTTIRKLAGLASEVGGMRKLKAIIDALTEVG